MPGSARPCSTGSRIGQRSSRRAANLSDSGDLWWPSASRRLQLLDPETARSEVMRGDGFFSNPAAVRARLRSNWGCSGSRAHLRSPFAGDTRSEGEVLVFET